MTEGYSLFIMDTKTSLKIFFDTQNGLLDGTTKHLSIYMEPKQ